MATKKVIWTADNGRQFDNENEAIKYEYSLGICQDLGIDPEEREFSTSQDIVEAVLDILEKRGFVFCE